MKVNSEIQNVFIKYLVMGNIIFKFGYVESWSDKMVVFFDVFSKGFASLLGISQKTLKKRCVIIALGIKCRIHSMTCKAPQEWFSTDV